MASKFSASVSYRRQTQIQKSARNSIGIYPLAGTEALLKAMIPKAAIAKIPQAHIIPLREIFLTNIGDISKKLMRK